MAVLIGNVEVNDRELAALAKVRRDPRAKLEDRLIRRMREKGLIQTATLSGERMIALRQTGRDALEKGIAARRRKRAK